MGSTKRAIKFQLNESKISILVFWMIMLIVDISALFASKYTGIKIGISQSGMGNVFSLLGLNIIPIIIYLITHNYELYYKNFPVSLSFSTTRIDFYKSMIVNNLCVVFVMATIQSILMKVDPIFVKFAGKEPIYDFKAFNIQTDSLIYLMIYLFIAFLLFSTIWNLIAALNYKFGPKFWIVLGTMSIFTGIILKIDLFDLVFPGKWLNTRIDILQSAKLSIITIVLYIIIYFIISNTNIKNKA